MRVQLLSDLHFEFHRDGGASFVASLCPDHVDVLVLAGDIAGPRGLAYALKLFGDRYRKVLYCPGNHDHWGIHREDVESLMGALEASNVHVLRNRVITIEGKRFVGTTLWFPETTGAHRYAPVWSDFKRIPDFKSWVYGEHERARKFLETEVREGDVVVTHYLPSWQSVSETYRGSETNCYFVADLEDLILERKPSLWCHGHTHGSMDYTLGATRILCNPFGYVGYELNEMFLSDLVLEV